MAGPIDPRLIKRARATRGFLVAGVAIGSATAILVLGQAWLLSRSLATVFHTHSTAGMTGWVAGLLALFAGRAVLGWLHTWIAQRTSAAVKSQLRRDIMAARMARPVDTPTTSGALITLVTQGLDALDGYYSKYLPQLVLAMIVPLTLGVAILTNDLISAVIVAITVPLIPLFMALVGWTTEAATRKRFQVQTRLAQYFGDLVAGLPTLQVFGRAKGMAEGLRQIEGRHRSETMRTLRISFLSSLVLELFSTLSVAVIAVTIGFRVVAGDMDLATAFFVLILAPEVYLPIRNVGVHYHDAADGVAAAEAAFEIIESADGADGGGGAAPDPREATIEFVSVSHTYADATQPALAGFNLRLEPGEVVALAGRSGGGKTTVLSILLGLIQPTEGKLLVDGKPLTEFSASDWRKHLALVSQNPAMMADTVGDAIRVGYEDATDAELRSVLDAAGAEEIPLSHPIADDSEGLSAGERRRVAIARALLRVRHGAGLLVLDEPTAGLDSDTEAAVIDAVRQAGAGALVVSHRPSVLANADRVVELTEARR